METGMREKLMEEYNQVVKMAQDVIAKTSSKDKKTRAYAFLEMQIKFPNIQLVGNEWRIRGSNFRVFDEKLKPIKSSDDKEIAGLRDPEDLSRMNLVKRPIESK